MQNRFIKKKGFTLAEVLVTLVIIGAVAALTIPSLVNNIGDQQSKITWKKAFSDISQATIRVAADNGGSLKGAYSSADTLLTAYLKYLNYTKFCSHGTSSGNCWHSSFKNLDGAVVGNGWASAAAVLSNGSLLYEWVDSVNCSYIDVGPARCGVFVVDINGFRGPNTRGKDIFSMHIMENNVKPFGISGDSFQNSCSTSSSGASCSAEYLYN